MGSDCFPKPGSLCLVLGPDTGKLGSERLPTHLTASSLLPMASSPSPITPATRSLLGLAKWEEQ